MLPQQGRSAVEQAMDFRKLLQEERRRARQQQQHQQKEKEKVDITDRSLDADSSPPETEDRASGAEEWMEQPLTPWSQR